MAAELEIEISAVTKGLTDGLKDATSKLRQFSDQAISFGKVFSSLVTLPIAALGAASVKAFGDVQALKKGLEVVAGSSAEAEKQFKSLTEVAKLPGLGLNEAVQGSINLQTIGFSAEKAEKSLKVFGNAVASVGKGRVEFERAIYGLQQLANTDFPLGEDLNILKDAIPQITPLLKEAFGTARTEELQKLGITSEQVIDTILDGLGKLPKVTGGINNAFENMGDSIRGSLSKIGDSINKTFDVEGLINKVAGGVDNLATGFSNLDESTQKMIIVFAGLAAAAGPVLLAIGGIIQALPLLAAGFAALTGPIGLIAIAVAAAIPLLVGLNSELSRTKEIAGQVKADLLEESLKGSREEFERLSKAFESTGLKPLEAQNKAIDALLLQEQNLLKSRLTGSRIDADASRARTKALIELKAEINKVNEAGNVTVTTFEKFSKIADLKNAEVFSKWEEELKGFNEQLLLTQKYQSALNALTGKEFDKKGIKDNGVDIGGVPVIEIPDFDDSKATAFLGSLQEFNDTASGIISNGISTTIGDMAFAIGEALVTGENVLKAAGGALLNGIAQIANQLGQAAIAIGVGMLAIKLAFKNPFTAIAAGVALVALAGAISASVAGMTSGIGGGSGGGGVGGSVAQSQSFGGSGAFVNPNDAFSNVTFTIEGTTLVGAIDRTKDRYAKG